MARKPKTQHEILSGIHSVEEALRAGRRDFAEIYFTRSLPENIGRYARDRDVPTRSISAEEIRKLAGTDQHQHVAAKVSPFPATGFPGPAEKAAVSGDPLYLILDSIEDPGNLGALIRTAACAGVSGIIVPKDRCAPLTPSVSRASAGAMEHASIYRVTNLVTAMKVLKQSKVWITGLEHKATLSLFDTDMTGAHAIVVGGENTGIRRLVSRNCDNLCHIPQFGAIGSLNASVAGAIGMYEALRQRLAHR